MRGLSLFLGLMKRKKAVGALPPGTAPTMKFNDQANSMNVAIISAMMA